LEAERGLSGMETALLVVAETIVIAFIVFGLLFVGFRDFG